MVEAGDLAEDLAGLEAVCRVAAERAAAGNLN